MSKETQALYISFPELLDNSLDLAKCAEVILY